MARYEGGHGHKEYRNSYSKRTEYEYREVPRHRETGYKTEAKHGFSDYPRESFDYKKKFDDYDSFKPARREFTSFRGNSRGRGFSFRGKSFERGGRPGFSNYIRRGATRGGSFRARGRGEYHFGTRDFRRKPDYHEVSAIY